MATTVKRVEAALEKRGLRAYIQAIERNPATPGEVIVWSGGGHLVYTCREAVELAKRVKLALERT